MHRTLIAFSSFPGLLAICLSIVCSALGMGNGNYPHGYSASQHHSSYSSAYTYSPATPSYINPYAVHVTPQPAVYHNVHNHIYIGNLHGPVNKLVMTNADNPHSSYQPSYAHQLMYDSGYNNMHTSGLGQKRSHEDAFNSMQPQQNAYHHHSYIPAPPYESYQYTSPAIPVPTSAYNYQHVQHAQLPLAPSHIEQPQLKRARTCSDLSEHTSSTPSSFVEENEENTLESQSRSTINPSMFGKFKTINAKLREKNKKLRNYYAAIEAGTLSTEQFISTIPTDKFHPSTVARLVICFQPEKVSEILIHFLTMDDSTARHLPYRPNLYTEAIWKHLGDSSANTTSNSKLSMIDCAREISPATFQENMLETFVREYSPSKASFDRYVRALKEKLNDNQIVTLARYHAEHPFSNIAFQSSIESLLPKKERIALYQSLDSAKLLEERNAEFIISTLRYVNYPLNLFHKLMEKKNYLGNKFSSRTYNNLALSINKHSPEKAKALVTYLTNNPLSDGTVQNTLLEILRSTSNRA